MKSHNLRTIALILWGLVFAVTPTATSSENYTINVAQSVAAGIAQEKVSDVLIELYRRVGITPNFVVLPSERGLRLVDSGEVDAEAARVLTIGLQYSHMLKVPTPMMTMHVSYYCLKQAVCATFSEKTIFAIPKGSDVLIQFCDTHRLNCLRINNDESGFKSLNAGVADVFLAPDWIARVVMCNSVQRQFFYRKEPRLSQSVYHYVHKKHENLIPRLDAAMQGIVNEGVVARFSEFGLNSYKSCGAELFEVHN